METGSARVAESLHVEFGKPLHGWIKVCLRSGGSVLEIDASDVPGDSIADLAAALSFLLKGGSEVTVEFNEEPCESEFRFSQKPFELTLTVIQFPDSRRSITSGTGVFEVTGTPLQICVPFWRGLRRLESEISTADYELGWGRPFPVEKMNEIASLIKD
jgi:hypothetical protein